MQKILMLTALLSVSAGIMACGSAQDSNPNMNVTNLNASEADANRAVNIDPANLPEGLSTKPIDPANHSAPGIPVNGQVNVNIDPNANIPGIPNSSDINKPMKPGSKPTPGIPDEETLRRQLKQVHDNANVPPTSQNAPGSTGARKNPRPVGQ